MLLYARADNPSLPTHDIDDEPGQRFRIEIRGLVRHAFSRRCNRLDFADFGRIEQEGSGPCATVHPIERLKVILGVENRFLLLLGLTERGDDELLQQGDVEFGAR